MNFLFKKQFILKLSSSLMIFMMLFFNIPFDYYSIIKEKIANRKIVDKLWLSQNSNNVVDNFSTAHARTYQYGVNSQTLITGTNVNITSATAAAAAGTNVGSWRGVLGNDNFHWSTQSTTSGADIQLNTDGVYLNGANKIEIQTEVDLDAALALVVQICDWVSTTGVDNAADAQCTGGGWRTLNTRNISNAAVGLTTVTTPVALRWHIYDGYFALNGTTPGTPVSTPLTNFVSSDSNRRVKIRYYSTVNNVSNIDVDMLRVQPFIDSVYEPADFVRLNTGNATTGLYINAQGPFGNTTTTVVSVTAHDAVYITVPGNTTPSEFYFKYKNIKTYEGMNTILVKSDYSCAATGVNITPRIYNFNTLSWENLTNQTIACATGDAFNQWAKNNINISHYINEDNEIWAGWIASATHATAHPRVDSMYIMLGTTNTDTTNCEIPIGTGTVADCANTRDLDTLNGSPSAWTIAREDESTNMGTGEENSYYPFDIDNDATAEEGGSGHIPFSVTVPSNAQVVGNHFAGRVISRTTGSTASTQLGMRDYSGYNTSGTGNYLGIGPTLSSTTYTYTDSVSAISATAYGQQQNPEDYVHTGLNEMKLRLRTLADGATSDNSSLVWDFAMVSLAWIESDTPTRTYQYNSTSQTLISGLDLAITSATAAAAAGTNVGSWRGVLGNDNFHWSTQSTTSGADIQLNTDGVYLNGANKIEIQTEVDLDAALALVVQICDWVSTTGVDNAADAQCTGGGWRTLNTRNISNAAVGLTTVTTPVALRWHIYDGYFALNGTTPGTPVSTPLTNFVSSDSNRRVKIRYYSTVNNVSNIDVDMLRVQPFIDSVYEPADFVRLNTGNATTGLYINAQGPFGNTTTTVVSVTAHDAVYITVPGNTTPSEFYFKYKNIKTYEGMNTILVKSDYSCAATGVNITPRIYNFNTLSWENLTNQTIACATGDAFNQWAKNNINISHYINEDNEIWAGWIASATHATAHPRVDSMYIMLGTTNTDTTNCEIPIGTGTVADCANTRDLDTLNGSPSAWTIAREDESTNMGTGEENSYYPFDIDNDATAEEGGSGHIPFSVTVPSNAQVVGNHFAGRVISRTTGSTASTQLGMRDYSGYNTSGTGNYLGIGPTLSSTTYTYTDSVSAISATAYGQQQNPEDYVHTGLNEMKLRLRTLADGATSDNSSLVWDFAMVSMNWVDTSCVVDVTGSWSNNLSTTPFDQGSGCRSNESGVLRAGAKENLVINEGITLTLDTNTPILEKITIYGTLNTNGYTLNAKYIEIANGGSLVLGSSTVNLYGDENTIITNSGTITPNTSAVNFLANGNFTLASSNTTLNSAVISGTGTKTFPSNLIFTGTLTLENGTVLLNNPLSVGSLVVDGGDLDLNSQDLFITGYGTIFEHTGGTLDASGSIIKLTDTSSNGKTFNGADGEYYMLWLDGGFGGGSYVITGSNTFDTFKDTGTTAHSVRFEAGSTQSINKFEVNGNSGQRITITSTNTNTHTLTSTGGNILVDYVIVEHSVANGTGTWTADSNSINNNSEASSGSGWIFFQFLARGGGEPTEAGATPDPDQGGGGAGGGGGSEGEGEGDDQGGGGAGGGDDLE